VDPDTADENRRDGTSSSCCRGLKLDGDDGPRILAEQLLYALERRRFTFQASPEIRVTRRAGSRAARGSGGTMVEVMRRVA